MLWDRGNDRDENPICLSLPASYRQSLKLSEEIRLQ